MPGSRHSYRISVNLLVSTLGPVANRITYMPDGSGLPPSSQESQRIECRPASSRSLTRRRICRPETSRTSRTTLTGAAKPYLIATGPALGFGSGSGRRNRATSPTWAEEVGHGFGLQGTP